MSKHYLQSGARIGRDKVGDVVHVYGNDAATSFQATPDDTHRLSLQLKVRSDETGRYVQPTITDAQIDAALSSILQ